MPQTAGDPYARNRGTGRGVQRVIVVMPREDVEAIDGWGGPAGMGSRNAAIRTLLRKGLDAVRTETSLNERS